MTKKLELEYKVTGYGDEVIVIENGLGGSIYDWHFVIDKLKKDATIISYHRAGYGNSYSPNLSRNTRQIAKELNSMLKDIGIQKKIILVGHSFGGLCAQQYAKMYPDMVKGIILVDSTSVNFHKLYSLNLPVMYSLISIEKLVENWNNISKKSKSEIKETNNFGVSREQALLPKDKQNSIREFEANPTVYKTMASEMDNWKNSSIDIKESGDFPNVPLTVIARDKGVSVEAFVEHDIPKEEAVLYEDVWRELQQEQSLLSERGKLVIVEGSDHNIQLEKPDILVGCIKEMVG